MTHETRPIDHSGQGASSANPEKPKTTTWQRFVEALASASGKTRAELATELGVNPNQINKYVARINNTTGKWIVMSDRGKIAINQTLLSEYHDFLMGLPSSEATMDKYGTSLGRHVAETGTHPSRLPKPVPRHNPAEHQIEDTTDDLTRVLEVRLEIQRAINKRGSIGGEAL
jgi:hypothetical protein